MGIVICRPVDVTEGTGRFTLVDSHTLAMGCARRAWRGLQHPVNDWLAFLRPGMRAHILHRVRLALREGGRVTAYWVASCRNTHVWG
jgi:hypothetical protein